MKACTLYWLNIFCNFTPYRQYFNIILPIVFSTSRLTYTNSSTNVTTLLRILLRQEKKINGAETYIQ